MARKPKNTAPKEEASTKTADAPKYGVTELADAVGIQPASVRVALRDLEVEKAEGGRYGWNTKKDFDEIVKALKERNAKRIAAPAEDSKPAKPARGKKTSAATEEAPAKPKRQRKPKAA